MTILKERRNMDSGGITRAPVQQEESKPVEPQIAKDKVSVSKQEQIEVPFTDYQQEHHHPYTVDHFELGDTWSDKYGGFTEEIQNIEGYFKNQIEQGKLDNSVEAVKTKLKGIYKLCNIDKTERITMQLEKLSAYIDFLKKTDHILLNHSKYGR